RAQGGERGLVGGAVVCGVGQQAGVAEHRGGGLRGRGRGRGARGGRRAPVRRRGRGRRGGLGAALELVQAVVEVEVLVADAGFQRLVLLLQLLDLAAQEADLVAERADLVEQFDVALVVRGLGLERGHALAKAGALGHGGRREQRGRGGGKGQGDQEGAAGHGRGTVVRGLERQSAAGGVPASCRRAA